MDRHYMDIHGKVFSTSNQAGDPIMAMRDDVPVIVLPVAQWWRLLGEWAVVRGRVLSSGHQDVYSSGDRIDAIIASVEVPHD
jgi:hypothetical protein